MKFVAGRGGSLKKSISDVGSHIMEDLRLLLIDRLKAKGVDPLLIPVFLKTLMNVIGSKPGIEQSELNQKLHSLGWDEVVIDYHSIQIAIACLEAESQ